MTGIGIGQRIMRAREEEERKMAMTMQRSWHTRTTTVGITGDMGSGKSYCSKLFSELGVPVFDSDAHAKEILNREDVRDHIELTFSTLNIPSFYKNGVYDAQIAKQLLFEGYHFKPSGLSAGILKVLSPSKAKAYSVEADTIRGRFNNTLKHYVIQEFYKWAEARSAEGARVVLFESAIIFELGIQHQFNKTIVVACEEMTQKKRALERSGINSNEYEKRMSMQLSQSSKYSRANYILHNEEATTAEQLRGQVRSIYEDLLTV